MPKLCIAVALLLLLGLGGCVMQRGEILGKNPLAYKDIAFISVGDDEYFWIAPPVSGRHGTPPAEMQIPKDGVWVREGWFVVEFQCFSPSDRPSGVDPILPETDDQKPVYIHAGHRYKLSCSPTRVGDIVLQDEGVAPAA